MKVQLFHRGEPIEVDVEATGDARTVRIGESARHIAPISLGLASGTLRIDGRPARFLYTRTASRLQVAVGGEYFDFDLSAESKKRAGAYHGNPETRAPMPGKVFQVIAEVGREVSPGDPLLILEAMKMENVLCAEMAGTIQEVHVKPGDMVEPGKLLVLIATKA